MTINYEIKSQLAKLLATEDLVVENRPVDTACFDVETRVLTLPLWEKASGIVYDMLVGHEVGHALFTPNQWDFLGKIPKAYVNVTEDARIEKLMKRKYPGLAKSFYKGYEELSEDDFFCLDGQDVNKMSLPDRINLHFKIGSFIDVRFTPQEQEIVDLVASSETFADAVTAAEVIHKFIGDQVKDQTQQPPQNNNTTDAPGSGDESGDEQPGESDSSDKETQDGDNEVEPQGEGETVDSTDQGELDPFKVETDEAFTDGAQSLTDTHLGKRGPEYYQVPKVDLDSIIAPNSDIHEACRESFVLTDIENFELVDSKYHAFKKSAQKEVNYLVKEFECKKAADTYARATTARTGVLDCSKLHTYKYNEDLFKKVSVIPDGKNHGLVFILDWSGSMSRVMLDTIKQLYNLMWFCKKVSIPFEVYAFTNEWKKPEIDYEKGELVYPADRTPSYEARENLLSVSEDFSLMNMFTSKVNGKQLEYQMINIWRIAKAFADFYHSGYSVPSRLSLSGTPLNETLVCLHQILPQFQRENKVQKVQCIILTDGEAGPLCYNKEIHPHWEEKPRLCKKRIIPGNDFVRNRKTGMTYSVGSIWHQFTGVLLEDLKMSLPYCNFIGIRILGRRDASSFIDSYCGCSGEKHDKAMISWRKEKSFSLDVDGYSKYFGLSSDALSEEADFEVSDEATKTQIKKAFIKSLNNKKTNKKILSEFISIVA